MKVQMKKEEPTLTIRGVNPGDLTQDVVGTLQMTRQGALEVLRDVEEWLAELKQIEARKVSKQILDELQDIEKILQKNKKRGGQ